MELLVHETERHDVFKSHHEKDQHFEGDEKSIPLLSSGILDRHYIAPDAVQFALVLLGIIICLWWHGACAGSDLGNVAK